MMSNYSYKNKEECASAQAKYGGSSTAQILISVAKDTYGRSVATCNSTYSN